MIRFAFVFLVLSCILTVLPVLAGEVEFHPQTGHSNVINCVDRAPDGVLALTASDDKTLRLWNTVLGKELRTYKAPNLIQYVHFLPDGGSFVTVSRPLIQVRRVDDGTVIQQFEANFDGFTASCFILSPDGRFLIGGFSRSLSVYDLKTGKMDGAFSIQGGGVSGVTALAFLPGGKFLLSGDESRNITLWDMEKRTMVRTFSWWGAHEKKIIALAVSPDGKLAASASEDYSVKIWDIQNGSNLQTMKEQYKESRGLAFLPDNHTVLAASTIMTLWDARTGKKTGELEGNVSQVYSMALRGDGRLAYTVCGDRELDLWDMEQKRMTSALGGRTGSIRLTGFSKDGKTIICNRALVETASGKLLRLLPTQNDHPEALLVPPDLADFYEQSPTRDLKNGLSLLRKDIRNGNQLAAFEGHQASITCSALSPDGSMILTGSTDRTLRLWDSTSGKVRAILSGHPAPVTCAIFSGDGKRIFSGDDQGNVRGWNTADGSLIYSEKKHDGEVLRLLCAPDSSLVVSTGSDGHIDFHDPATGVTRANRTDEIFAFTEGGRKVIMGGTGSSWHLADTSQLLDESTFTRIPSPDGIIRGALSPDGKSLVFGRPDGKIEVHSLAAPEKTVMFSGQHDDWIFNLAFSPDGKLLASDSADGTLKLWDFAQRKLLYTAVMGNTSSGPVPEWLVWDSLGHWDSSPGGGELVAMVQGLQSWNIDQFAVRNNRPDLIVRQVPGADPELAGYLYLQYLKRLKRMGFVNASGQADESLVTQDPGIPVASILSSRQDDQALTLKLRMEDSLVPLRSWNIWVNDVPLFGARGKSLTGQKAELEESVILTPGTNKIEVGCQNSRGSDSLRSSTTVIYTPAKPVQPDLYFLGFGVSRYKDSSLNLQFADKDALDLEQAFLRMSGSYRQVHTRVLVNEECTAENLRKSKDFLLQAKPADTVVLFIAGHGIHDTDKEATYYFVTHETDISKLSSTAANFDLVEDLLQGIAPRSKLFLMDTCESGEVEEDLQARYYALADSSSLKARAIDQRRGLSAALSGSKPALSGSKNLQPGSETPAPGKTPAKRSWLFEKDRYLFNDLLRRSGAIVFSSCRGGEFSYESVALGNGFFTRKILEALSGSASKSGYRVGVKELEQWVTQEVSALSKGEQNPVVDRDNIYQVFDFPVVR